MAIEILLHTERSLASATRLVLDRMTGAGFENIDAPEDGRVEVDCLDGESGEEWGLVAPETSPMDAFLRIKERETTVRVTVKLRSGHILLFPGFVVLSRPEEDFEDFTNDPRARQILLREGFELARAFGAREIVLAGDAASDFLGTEATSWEGLKDVLGEEEIEHTLLPVPRPGAEA
jgi:hypothetical protein